MKLAKPVKLSEETISKSKTLQVFEAPDLDSRPMARMWFPDAGAGEVENDCILEQFQSMAAGGIGGVEVALLGDDTGNLDAERYGWGTPNWVRTMKKVLKAAKQTQGGFKVDFTITSHWPPVVNTIDPNDAAACIISARKRPGLTGRSWTAPAADSRQWESRSMRLPLCRPWTLWRTSPGKPQKSL